MKTFKIPAVLLDKFEAKIDVLNKRASKIGAKPIEYRRLGETIFERYADEEVPCVIIELNQEEELKIEGYVFKAKLQRNMEKTYVYMGDESVPQEQKDIRICQHCNTNRVRKFYYVLQKEEDGSYITVGRSCLKDFIGHTNIEKIADFFQDVKSLEEEFGFSNGGKIGLEKAYSVESVLRVAYVSTLKRGYVKSSYYDEDSRESTKSHVFDIFYNYDKPDTPKRSYKEYRDMYNDALELDKGLIEDMIDFVLKQEPSTSFIQNLHAIIEDNFVIEKMFGYIVCIPSMYLKAKERELKEQLSRGLKATSDYVGVEGEKIDISVTLADVKHFESNYGLVTLYFFIDEDNNQIVWKTASGKDINIGDKVNMVAKVKEHNEYDGIKQTIVLRPKFSK